MSDLIIYGYKYKTGNKIGKFTLQLNPIAIKIKRGTENQKEDDKKDASGNSTQSTTAKFQPAEIDLKFTLDKTGVVNKQINSKDLSSLALQDVIKNLEDIKKSEIYLPFAAQQLLSKNIISIDAIDSDSEWFGVTYKEDKENSVERLNSYSKQGIYPAPLW